MNKILLLLLALIGFRCNEKIDNTQNTENETSDNTIFLTKKQFEVGRMEIDQIGKKDFAQTFHVNGKIDVSPQNKAVISAFLGGYIRQLMVMPGDQVSKGQLLVRLENPEFIRIQQEYLELKEQMNFLKSEYNRQKTMFGEKITSEKVFLKAESDYNSNMARFNSLRKSLELLNMNPASVEAGNITSSVGIYSPISGVVTALSAETGGYISPSDKILEVVNPKEMMLHLQLYEKELFLTKVGQIVYFRIPEISEDTFTAKVQRVGAFIDPVTRRSTVLAEIENRENHNFAVGMFVEADIVQGEEEVYALPETAVVDFEESTYVLTVQNENEQGYELFGKEVKVGKSFQGFTVIENHEDFLPETKILTKGGFVLLKEEGGDLGNGH